MHRETRSHGEPKFPIFAPKIDRKPDATGPQISQFFSKLLEQFPIRSPHILLR
jgi:hypothetical protein